MSRIQENDWTKLRLAFEQNTLVLVIGPWFNRIAGQFVAEQLATHLHRELDAENRPETSTDLTTIAGLLVRDKGRATLEVAVDQFFQQTLPVSDMQGLLAQLPFKIIINASRDKQICNALDLHNVKYREELYHFKQPREFVYNASDSRTFVYHLFGAVNCRDDKAGQTNKTLGSLVMTGADQVEFVKQVVQTERKIPNSLLAELNDTKTYLFLGFNFDDWYLRLLLYGLGLSDSADAMPSWAVNAGSNELNFATTVFFSSRYKLNFLSLDEQTFIQDLHRRYTEMTTRTDTALNEGKTLKALVVYDSADEGVRAEFMRALAPLRNRYRLEVQELLPGDQVLDTLAEQARNSQFIFPLITANFLASDPLIELFYDKILPLDTPGKTIVSPVLGSPCQWKPLLRGPVLNAVLPNNLEPVSKWADPAEAWTDVAQEIEKRIKIHFLS
ncbi:MAG: SIR2 family protein [Saprospiraceae bacterium]|nr:SIR2 family protein [Saprospiraceae bacterium]